MKRTTLSSLLAFLFVGIACLSFTACGGSDDGGNTPSSSQLIGIWYEYDDGYIHGYCFNVDGTGWKGEWKQGGNEEHRGFTWKVDGNTVQTFNINGGDMMDNLVFTISSDGKTLTLSNAKSGKVKGIFTKQ